MKLKVVHSYLQSVNEKKGFTLIELLVVIVITGILPAIAITSLLKHYDRAHPTVGELQAGLAKIEEDTKKVHPVGRTLVGQKSLEELIYGESHGKTRVTEQGTTWDAQVSTHIALVGHLA